jgi:hypothetical protein
MYYNLIASIKLMNWCLSKNNYNIINIECLLIPKGRRSIFSKNCSYLPFLAKEVQAILFLFFAILTVRSCPRLLEEHVVKVSKSWPHGLWDYDIWSGKKSFFSLCPIKTTEFDLHLWNLFELRNFEILHHLNAHHHVRYMSTKS